MSFNDELSTAINLAEKTGQYQLDMQHSIENIIKKTDASPVTEIDRQSEFLIRSALEKRFPNDSFLGEESGFAEGSSGRKWIVDPLDGTRPFIRGIPTHSVLIALEENGEPVLGVIFLPALKLLCYAVKGGGAFCNQSPIHVSTTPEISQAMGSTLGFVENASNQTGQNILELMKSWDYTYGFMDAYSYVLLASGHLDICVNLLDKPWDCAAAAAIITEAGGKYSDLPGKPTVYGGSIIFSNKILHDDVLKFFNSTSN